MYSWFKTNPADFSFREFSLNSNPDLDLVLVNPLPSFHDWTEENKIYRSSIWTKKEGLPVSLGFKKFTNLGEKPDFEPIDPAWIHAFYYEKLDGSCLIVSRPEVMPDQLIIRTRGTFSVMDLNNGEEALELLHNVIPDKSFFRPGYSYLFEWCTPTNQIVVKYDEPKLFLIGIVEHSSYTYLNQGELDNIALAYNIPRPRRYNFLSTDTKAFNEAYLADNNSTEGVVIYFNNGQILKKLKTDWYCRFHSFRFNLGSEKYLLKLLWENKLFNFSEDKHTLKQKLFDFVESQFDFEVAYYASVQASNLLEKWEMFRRNVNYITRYIDDCKTPDDVLNRVRTNPEVDTKLAWPIFRKKEFSLVTLKNYLLK